MSGRDALLDCGHAPSTSHTYNGKPAWEFVIDFDGKRKICHACADARILDCGHTPSPHEVFTTGYGQDTDGKTFCYECCAVRDRESMIRDGRATLYFADGWLQNWPGTLKFPVFHVKRSLGSGFGRRYYVHTGRFIGPDGKDWAFRNAGDNQIARCKRLKHGSN